MAGKRAIGWNKEPLLSLVSIVPTLLPLVQSCSLGLPVVLRFPFRQCTVRVKEILICDHVRKRRGFVRLKEPATNPLGFTGLTESEDSP